MEHTELDISAINYGNKCLDNWLSHEESFVGMITKSEPMRICLVSTFHTLVKLGELLPLEKTSKETFDDAVKLSKEWDNNSIGFKGTQLIKSIIAINRLAEKRLSVTVGL